ncbi:hypothetical protein MRB53_020781 [Persea americana]|uniref:Uncharacterized protein n=1 Tax=Persea americana TaxID=3435 RepID=A0ACC2L1V7_PERAE|nr:hypothetical protein MRB53_020781 [Persea americana]
MEPPSHQSDEGTPATSSPSSPLSFDIIFVEIQDGQPLYPFFFQFSDYLQGIPAHLRSMRSIFGSSWT